MPHLATLWNTDIDHRQHWTFEDDYWPGSEDWYLFQTHAEAVSLQEPGDCPGDGGIWWNADYSEYSGYGNNWDDYIWHDIEANFGTRVILTHAYELDEENDFAIVQVRSAGDPGKPWVEIGRFSGAMNCATDTLTIPDDAIIGSGYEIGVANLTLRLRMVTDEAGSAEDGLYCGFGWYVDEVRVITSPPRLPGGKGPYEQQVPDDMDLPFDVLAAIPGEGGHELLSCFPNPFNPRTTIAFELTKEATVQLRIYDMAGRLVDVLVDGERLTAGRHERACEGKKRGGARLASGIYFCRIEVENQTDARRLLLLK